MKFTKRMLSVFVALIMLISIAAAAIPVGASNNPTLSLGVVECDGNGDVVVPLSIEDNPGIWGINLQIEYDENLTYKSIAKANSDIGSCMATTDDNVITFLLEAASEEKNITADGVLANFTFSVANWADGEEFDVSFTFIDRKSITDASGEDLLNPKAEGVTPITLEDGAVKCVSNSYGEDIPSEPSTVPTEPSTQPTEPSSEATEPSSSETEATEPSTEPTQPSSEEPSDPFETVDTFTGETSLTDVEVDPAYLEGDDWVYDYKYYKFVPKKAGWFLIESVSDYDTKAELYDENGELLVESDDANENEDNYNFSINYYFEKGATYYLAIASNEEDTIVFDVTVSKSSEPTQPSTEATEPSSSETEATEPSSSETPDEPEDPSDDVFDVVDTITGAGVIKDVEIDSYYDEDYEEYVCGYKYYKFVPETSGWYLFETYTEFDSNVTLYDAEGEWLESSDDKFVDDYNFSLNYEFEAGETYYLEFSAYSEVDAVYDVTVSESTEDYAPIWTPEYENEFAGEGEFDITVGEFDEYDEPIPQVIKFVPDATGKYTFTAESEIYATVLDSTGNIPEVEFDDDYNEYYVLTADETYYLYVYAYEDGKLEIKNTDIETPSEPSETEPSSSETEATEPSSEEPSSEEPSSEEPSSEAPSSEEPSSEESSSNEPSSSETPDEPDEPTVCVHTTIIKNAKEATYEEDGYTGDEVCVKCGEVVTEGTVIPKLEKPEEPTESSTDPVDPTDPSNPSNPSEPVDPTEPSSSETEVTEPSTEATKPSTEATKPSTEATDPSTEATKPSTEATKPSTEATDPSTEAPSSSEVPSSSDQTTGTTAKPTVKPTTKPSQPTKPVCVHTTVVKGAIEATCFVAGYTGDTTCIKCGVVTAKGSVIAKIKLVKPKFSVVKKGKKIKVKYTKVAGATGFQVRYKLGKGKWIVKTYNNVTKATVTKTLKKLKKGTYKVQVRALAAQKGSKTLYSKWAKKKVKI